MPEFIAPQPKAVICSFRFHWLTYIACKTKCFCWFGLRTRFASMTKWPLLDHQAIREKGCPFILLRLCREIHGLCMQGRFRKQACLVVKQLDNQATRDPSYISGICKFYGRAAPCSLPAKPSIKAQSQVSKDCSETG